MVDVTIAVAEEHQLMTVDAFEAFIAREENADRRFELINGEIVEKMPTEEHGVIAALLIIIIGQYAKANKLGRVAVEVRHRIPQDDHNSRVPDISFTRAENAGEVVRKGSKPTMPDWAIEIQSPGDSLRAMREKATYYLHNGTMLVWLIYPRSQTVDVCRKSADGIIQIEAFKDGAISADEVLTGFSVNITDIFDVE